METIFLTQQELCILNKALFNYYFEGLEYDEILILDNIQIKLLEHVEQTNTA